MNKVAIIGAGHNALVAACYLAKAGLEVDMYEKADKAGGLCINSEVWPGYNVSIWANWSGMFAPKIIEDLELSLPPILHSGDAIITASGGCYSDKPYFEGLREEDLDDLSKLESDFCKLAGALSKQFLAEHPSKKSLLELTSSLELNFSAEELLSSSFLKTVDRYISHKELATAIGYESFTHPLHPGSAYGHVHMRVADHWGEGWGMIKGGMGAITDTLIDKAKELGVRIHTGVKIERVYYKDNKLTYALGSDGKEITSEIIISGTDYFSLQTLLGREIKNEMRDHPYGNANIHIKLSSLPNFTALDNLGIKTPPTMTLVPTREEIEAGYVQYLKGENIDHPVISIGIPSLIDPNRAPDDKHFMCIHPDHAPLKWNGKSWSYKARQEYIQHILDETSRYAPNIHECVEDAKLFCADDLSQDYGALGAHCFHGDISWPFALEDRMPDYGAGPYTDIKNLYLCGSSCAPGGTVTGAPGYRCAMAIIKDISNAS